MILRDLALVPASVPVTATFREAADALRDSGLPAIAVVDHERKVAGLFTDGDLLRGLFPAYLSELRHTTFVLDDQAALIRRAQEVAEQPVTKLARKARSLELEAEASSTHAAERFLHCEEGALPVVDADDRFVGMLARSEFALAMLRQRLES